MEKRRYRIMRYRDIKTLYPEVVDTDWNSTRAILKAGEIVEKSRAGAFVQVVDDYNDIIIEFARKENSIVLDRCMDFEDWRE